MKHLMENWKSFLHENKEEYLKTLGLHIKKENGEYNAYLYEWNPKRFGTGWPIIVGMIGTMQMDSNSETPCIPETHEIGQSAVRDTHRGKGIGTHLYEVVAYYIKMEHDGGITSDHSASTTKDAAKVWAKLRDKLNYVKRKTPKGPDKKTLHPKTGDLILPYKGENDEFDYNDSTPDPNDDCYEPSEGRPASTNSLQIPPDRMQYVAKLMEIQLDNFDTMLAKAKEYSPEHAGSDGAGLFNREYDPYVSGIHGGEEPPTKNQREYYGGEWPVFENWKKYLDEGALHYFPDGEKATPEEEQEEEEGFWNSFGLIGDDEIDKFISDVKNMGFEEAVVENIKYLGDQQVAWEMEEEIKQKIDPSQKNNLRIY